MSQLSAFFAFAKTSADTWDRLHTTGDARSPNTHGSASPSLDPALRNPPLVKTPYDQRSIEHWAIQALLRHRLAETNPLSYAAMTNCALSRASNFASKRPICVLTVAKLNCK